MIEVKPLENLINDVHPESYRILIEGVFPHLKVTPKEQSTIENESEKATHVDSSNGSESCQSK